MDAVTLLVVAPVGALAAMLAVEASVGLSLVGGLAAALLSANVTSRLARFSGARSAVLVGAAFVAYQVWLLPVYFLLPD